MTSIFIGYSDVENIGDAFPFLFQAIFFTAPLTLSCPITEVNL